MGYLSTDLQQIHYRWRNDDGYETRNKVSSIEVVSGTTDTDASTAVTFSNGTSLSKMFHFCSFSYNVADDEHWQTFRSTALTATDTLTIYSDETSGNNAITYRCYIVIFTDDSPIVVNRYVSDTDVETRSVTITEVSTTSAAFVIPHGQDHDNADTSIGSEESYEYRLTSTTNVDIVVDFANDYGDNAVRFEVVDWNNSDIWVQHLNNNAMTTAETTDTASIPTAITGIFPFPLIAAERSE